MNDCQKPATVQNQDTILYHDGKSINDPNFDLEDSFCAGLNKIKAVADLFYVMGGAQDRQLTSEGAFGVHELLEDAAEELRTICYHMWKNQGVQS